MSEAIKTDKLLLVEGKDEENLFSALLEYLQIENVTIRSAGGYLKFAKLYPSVAITTGFSSIKKIGFVRDAEENEADSAFQSISNIVKKYTPNIMIPNQAGEIAQGNIKCGIFIMPNNKNPGMLEDLCLESVKGSLLYNKAEKYILEAEALLKAEDKEHYNIHKAKIQSYLAGTTNIPRNLGEASLQGLWDFSSTAFNEVKNFILSLFS